MKLVRMILSFRKMRLYLLLSVLLVVAVSAAIPLLSVLLVMVMVTRVIPLASVRIVMLKQELGDLFLRTTICNHLFQKVG